MAIPLKHDRHSAPVPQQASQQIPEEAGGQEAPGKGTPRRKPMQRAARGKREAPDAQGAPEYYAKDRMPSVAKPGPDGAAERPDDDE